MHTTSRVALLSLIATTACGPTAPLTPAEIDNLMELVLDPDSVPDDPTNAWADDPRAVDFGKKLFHDTRFSGPLWQDSDLGEPGELGRVGCITCHDPAMGGADRRSGGPTSHGAGWTARNAPTILDAALSSSPWMFWDGRKDSLWSQALGPPEAHEEYNSSRLYVTHRLFELYRGEYEAVFGPMPDLTDSDVFPPPGTLCDDTFCLGKPGDAVWSSMLPEACDAVDVVYANFGKAIAAYERQLVGEAPFDAYMRGETHAMSPGAIRGARLFVGRASCNECHRGPTLSDGKFHNLGVPQQGDAQHGLPITDDGRSAGIAQVLGDPFNAAGAFSDDPSAAGHLDGLRARPDDLAAFKTPTLRNLELTAPYMHNGSFASLWDVLAFYTFGGGSSDAPGIHAPAVQPLALSDEDIHDLVEFLHALTGPAPAELTTPPELP